MTAPPVLNAAAVLRAVNPGTRHPLHDDAHDWPATNCYVDLWIELLHALGLDPVAGLGGTVALDFAGDQWTFFKYSLDDIFALYGIDVQELMLWRPLIEHTEHHVAAGQPLIIEVDAWFLPDTAGITYHERHEKSSIAVQGIDRAGRRLQYFHNSGFNTLEADDFDGIFLSPAMPERLAPYVEVVKLDLLSHRPAPELATCALELARRHFRRRPRSNPVRRYQARVAADSAWLRDEGLETFHQYAFAMLRQCGAGFATGAAFLRWLATNSPAVDVEALGRAASDYEAIGRSAKAVQFGLARAVSRRRDTDFAQLLDEMAASWDDATAQLRIALET